MCNRYKLKINKIEKTIGRLRREERKKNKLPISGGKKEHYYKIQILNKNKKILC